MDWSCRGLRDWFQPSVSLQGRQIDFRDAAHVDVVERQRADEDDLSLGGAVEAGRDRKSTRLNSSHLVISYAVFCLKKKTHTQHPLENAPRSPQHAARVRPPPTLTESLDTCRDPYSFPADHPRPPSPRAPRPVRQTH